MSEEHKVQYPERADRITTLLGWLKDFFGQFRLAWELMWDERVPLVAKLVPILTLVYLFLPVDIFPDMALGLGQLDDLAIFLIGLRLFIDVCPPAVVAEHQEEARREMTVMPPDAQPPTITVVTSANTQCPPMRGATPPQGLSASTGWSPSPKQIIDLEAQEVNAQPPTVSPNVDPKTKRNTDQEAQPRPDKPKLNVPHVW